MKIKAFMMAGMFSFGALISNASDKKTETSVGKEDAPEYNIPAAQNSNFERKTIGYKSVVNENSLAAKTENQVGEYGTAMLGWQSRKGKIGYNALVEQNRNPRLIFGFNSCISEEGELVRYPDISDRHVLTNKWSNRKGKIGYSSVIQKEMEVTCCAVH